MKCTIAMAMLALSIFNGVQGDSVPFVRINKNDSALLIVDHQVGLFSMVRDFDHGVFERNMYAHAELGKIFSLPTIITSSAEYGPNGPIPQRIINMHPNAPFIRRPGEINAWDNPEFREAVRATNKTQMIIAGIVTDVCTTHLALSLREEGYQVFANIEASGTTTELIRDTANLRMLSAGVQLMSFFSIFSEIMRDWRSTPGALETIPWLDKYLPQYAMMARAHGGAVQNGTLIPGEQILINS